MAERELEAAFRDLAARVAASDAEELERAMRLALVRDLALLFVGAFAQWLLTTLFTRWAVFNQPALVFVAAPRSAPGSGWSSNSPPADVASSSWPAWGC